MGFFDFFSKSEDNSKNAAKDRLKFVLIHDRAMLPSGTIEKMKDDIISVISKYVEIDENSINIQITQSDEDARKSTLVANVPLALKTINTNEKSKIKNKKKK